MRFSAESLSQENRPTISSPENLEQIQPDADAYSVFGVAYNPKTRELKRGYQKRMMTGEHDQSILSKLFEAGPEKTVSQDTCSMGLTTSKIPYHAVASRIGRLRSILKNFGLTIYKIPNGGYSLREK